MIAEKLSVSFEDNVEVVDDRPGKDSAYLLDSTKAKENLEWESLTSLEQGLDETIAWMKENIEELEQQPFDYIHKP